MRPTYLICNHARPWQVLFAARDLEEVASSLRAQTDDEADQLHVYGSYCGQSRELTVAERSQLDAALRRPAGGR